MTIDIVISFWDCCFARHSIKNRRLADPCPSRDRTAVQVLKDHAFVLERFLSGTVPCCFTDDKDPINLTTDKLVDGLSVISI